MRIHNKIIVFFTAWLMLTGGYTILFAQNSIYFDHITTQDGLSQSDINSIYQDSRGFMWFGTHDGLNKYDGYKFTVYNPDPILPESISSNLIYAITGDKDGNLWIGTTGGGLSFFNQATGKFTNYRRQKNKEGSLTSDYISSVHLDNKNQLWVGTSRGVSAAQVSKTSDTLQFKDYSFERKRITANRGGNRINVIYRDSHNQLWAGGDSGLYMLSRDKEGGSYFRWINEDINMPTEPIKSISEDKTGRLLVGTDNGLYCQSRSKDLVKMVRLNKQFEALTSTILVDNYNNIWAGSNSGLLYFENLPQDEYPVFVEQYIHDLRNPNSISKNIVKSLFKDKTGIIWVGTNGGGINKFDPERKQFYHHRNTLDPKSLSYDNIRAIYEDSYGNLWIGTEGGGLDMLPKKNDDGRYLGFEKFKNIQKIFTITEVQNKGKKTLYLGSETTPGLFVLDITNPQKIVENEIIPLKEVSRSVFALLEDHNKNLWIGTYDGGLFRWAYNKDGDYEKDILIENPSNPNSLSNNIIRNIFEDTQNNLWFATADGLCMLKPEEVSKKYPNFEVFRNIPDDSTSISHNYILEVFESKAGDLWIGTFGGGLNKFIPPSSEKDKGSFISYSEKDGLPNNVIKGILEDDNGNLWLSTNQGITRFNPKEETFTNYDTNDGLQANEFQELARLRKKDGEMLFGGINGFNSFYPQNIKENTFEAETAITDFIISNEPIGVGEKVNGRVLLKKPLCDTEEIRLKYWENNFSFEFAALHYAASQKNQFAYMLEGFDEQWTYTTADKRFATYTNLSHGDYVLKVKTSNNDNVWDKTPTELKITIIPPFWRTNAAYLGYCLLIITLLIVFWKSTINRTNRKHKYQLDSLEQEKQEEVQQMKLEFFTNISHEFRTPLTLIKGPLEYLQKQGGALKQEVLEEQYNLMHKNTDYLLRLVNQLLDFRKMNQGKMRLVVRPSNVIDFLKEVGEPFQFMAHKQNINFTINTSDAPPSSWFDHDAMEKIMNNLLSNAFKFTPDNGTITIRISVENQGYHANDSKKELEPKKYLVIEVKDSGSGISKNKIENIFERFYVAKDKEKRNPEGVGIGLSFVKRLVELHQGSIRVESSRGQGSNFIVKLPAERESYENIPEISCKKHSENDFLVRSSEIDSFAIGINDEIVDQNITKSRSKLPVLLIVDDNADIRAFIKQALSEKYTIHEAENGEQGLMVAIKIIPNIIITDVLMPIMDGIKFCKKLKMTKETSHIPVLMVTAKSSQESEVQGLKTGADDYIRKPFDMELLELKLINIINQREELRKLFNRKVTLQPQEVTVTSADEKFLQKAIEIVEKHMMNTDFNVEMMVKEMSLSRSNLYLKFKELTGLSSSEFIRNIRLKRAMQLLEQSDMSVKEIMYMTGFNTASYFSKCFKKQFGVVPSEYVKQTDQSEK